MVLVEGIKGKVPKDRSWNKVKVMMAKVDQFLDSLINYKKEDIPPNVLTAIAPYLADKEFDPDFVRSKSAAAAAPQFGNGFLTQTVKPPSMSEVTASIQQKMAQSILDADTQQRAAGPAQ